MKKIDELKQTLETVKGEVRSLNEAGKVEEAEAKLTELRSVQKQIEIQSELDKDEKREVENKMTKEIRKVDNNEIEVRNAFYKAVAGKSLTQEERALVYSADANGDGLLIPQDIQTKINELKRQYASAKSLLDVVSVTTESGSFVVEDTSTMTGLTNFDDTTTGLTETNPKFRNIEYKVVNYGNITPVAKSFLQDETANFMAYLSKHFARKAVMTENTKIFAELKTGKTSVAVADLKGLKKVVNVNLDPAIKSMAVIVTNQDGFQFFDEMEDGNGRPLLQPNPSQETEYLLLGRPLHVFSNAELPTTGTTTKKAPVFIGALSEGAKFFDRGVYEVGVSEHAGFKQNQVVAKVVERFDVKQSDADAYVLAEVTVVAGV